MPPSPRATRSDGSGTAPHGRRAQSPRAPAATTAGVTSPGSSRDTAAPPASLPNPSPTSPAVANLPMNPPHGVSAGCYSGGGIGRQVRGCSRSHRPIRPPAGRRFPRFAHADAALRTRVRSCGARAKRVDGCVARYLDPFQPRVARSSGINGDESACPGIQTPTTRPYSRPRRCVTIHRVKQVTAATQSQEKSADPRYVASLAGDRALYRHRGGGLHCHNGRRRRWPSDEAEARAILASARTMVCGICDSSV